MRESIQDSVTRFLRYQRVPKKVTRQFRALKHNAQLLPRLQSQLEIILEAHGKFEPVVYDIQGPRDDGSDIVLRSRSSDNSQHPELLCFQVKSFSDLNQKEYLQELKAQRYDSFRKILGLRYYFLVLCTDAEAHETKIRSITQEFKGADRTEIIEPAFAYTFLNLPKTRIEAVVKRTTEADDYVFQSALDALDGSSPSARALTVYLAVKSVFTGSTSFSLAQLSSEPSLRGIYDELRYRQAELLHDFETSVAEVEAKDDDFDYESDAGPVQLADFEDQIAADLELLDSDVELDRSSDRVIFKADQFRALTAVIADALARYEYGEEQLTAYMFDLFIRD
ncbi:MAG: hypothetical protein ABSD98_00480 [Candidatus Korobacteraceae bacterium]|jgi:hypothetical protein